MEQPRVERRLAAILAADVAGYSRLIGADEEGTLARLKAIRADLVDCKIAEHRGRIVKTTGDGLLVEFQSVVDAVRCATQMQEGMAERNAAVPVERRIEWRIGINVGDIVVEDGDTFGDGVNVAARLEGLAEPGGVCVSARVHEDTAGRLDLAFEDIGEQSLKNIARPVRVYRIGPKSPLPNPPPHAGEGGARSARLGAPALPPLSLPDKPSIAVLSFTNMSGDPEQEFFAGGIAEDIITTLSKSRSLFVIARDSTFTYKGKAVAVKDIGRELGVRYVLEGSVRKAANRVRVTAQLIEAATGGHLWAERYDRDLADIFAVQDEITLNVSAAIRPALERSEGERAARKPPESLDAWECYHRGMWHFANVEAAEIEKARGFFQRAIELDPRFAPAYAAVARTYLRESNIFRPELRPEYVPRALDYARHAIAIDPTDARGHTVLVQALMNSGRHAEAIAEADLAVGLEPKSAFAIGTQGNALAWGGRPREGIEPLRTAMRLSPFDPSMSGWLHYLARAHYWAGDYESAIAVARQLRNSAPNFRQAYATLMSAFGQLGQIDEAHAVMAEARERFGEGFQHFMTLPLSVIRELRPEDREHLIEGYRKAGLVA
jgi:adenylate cyclase